jgi:hypothetical protein
VPAVKLVVGWLEKAMSRESNIHAGGESDGCIIPTKCPNSRGQPPAEGAEGRQPTKENTGQATAPRTQSRISELIDLLGVRKAARKDKRARFPSLWSPSKKHRASVREEISFVDGVIRR